MYSNLCSSAPQTNRHTNQVPFTNIVRTSPCKACLGNSVTLTKYSAPVSEIKASMNFIQRMLTTVLYHTDIHAGFRSMKKEIKIDDKARKKEKLVLSKLVAPRPIAPAGVSRVLAVLLKSHFVELSEPSTFYSLPLSAAAQATRLDEFFDKVASLPTEGKDDNVELHDRTTYNTDSALVAYSSSRTRDVVFQMGMPSLGYKKTMKVVWHTWKHQLRRQLIEIWFPFSKLHVPVSESWNYVVVSHTDSQMLKV